MSRQTRAERQPHTFVLDQELVERARREVGETDVVRSIEAALAAAIDYNSWVREVREGRRDVLS
jgi:post-segregation antitoxin (ccd killing protein)